VSTGPEQREIVDCTNLSYADCVQKAHRRRVGKFKQSHSPSTPETKDKVARHRSPGQSDLGDHQRDHDRRRSGPEKQAGPRCAENQTVESAQQVLTASGFTKTWWST